MCALGHAAVTELSGAPACTALADPRWLHDVSQAVPLRPILLDSALEYVQPPSLEHRLDKQPAARSLTSRLWGGWGVK